MTEQHKLAIEKMAEEISHYTYHMDSHEMKIQIFIAGASVYDELIQKEIERLRRLLEDNYKKGIEDYLKAKGLEMSDYLYGAISYAWDQFCKENNLLPTNPTT